MSLENRDVNEIQNGSAIIHIKNTDLAVCLLSVGVLLRKDPPYVHRKFKDGREEVVFNFNESTSDGMFKTMELVEAFRQDMKFIEENPEHPFTFAMAAVKNKHSFVSHFKSSTPYIGFKAAGGKTIMYVMEGGKKHKNCLAKGMVQV